MHAVFSRVLTTHGLYGTRRNGHLMLLATVMRKY